MVQTVLGYAVSTVAAVKPAARTMDIVLMDVNQVTHLHSVMTVRTLEIKFFAALVDRLIVWFNSVPRIRLYTTKAHP